MLHHYRISIVLTLLRMLHTILYKRPMARDQCHQPALQTEEPLARILVGSVGISLEKV